MSLQRLGQLLVEYQEPLLMGIRVTIELSILGMLLAVVTALFACLGMLSRNRIIRMPAILYVEWSRNTPILVQLVWVHFAWPELFGIKFDIYTSSVLALALQSSGYLAEEYRAGIESIEKGQFEASKSLGMTYPRMMGRVILPQAFMRMLPGILNQFVTCFKSTSIVSVIAVPDLMYQAGLIASATFLPMQIYSFVAVLYFIMVLIVSSTVRQLSRRLPNFGYYHGERMAA